MIAAADRLLLPQLMTAGPIWNLAAKSPYQLTATLLAPLAAVVLTHLQLKMTASPTDGQEASQAQI